MGQCVLWVLLLGGKIEESYVLCSICYQFGQACQQLNKNLGSTCKEPSARPMRLFLPLMILNQLLVLARPILFFIFCHILKIAGFNQMLQIKPEFGPLFRFRWLLNW